MDPELSPFVFAAVGIVLATAGLLLPYMFMYQKVEQGQALIVNKMQRVDVYFTGGLAIPMFHQVERITLTTRPLVIDRRGKDGIHCKDNIRADVAMKFFVRINHTREDVLAVAQSIGAARASDPAILHELFAAKFSDALRTVLKQLDFEELLARRDEAKDRILEVIGQDLNGFVLDDATFEHLEQTPISSLDPDHILDAEGIRRITERAAEQRTRAARAKAESQREIAKLEHETRQLQLELERLETDALAKFRADTGRPLTREQLDERLMAKLRQLLDVALQERLGEGHRPQAKPRPSASP